MVALSEYYGRAKAGIAGINPAEAADLGEDWLIAGATGAALGALSAMGGGLDKKVAGFPVPLDGVASAALALGGLLTHSKELKVASIAAAGSASTRAFEKIFKKGVGAHGELDEGTLSLGYGAEGSHDRLVEAAKYL
jgi:hypothetical protein